MGNDILLGGSGNDIITAYDPVFLGGVRVATGDINNDGTPDIITGAGPGGGPHVRIFSGTEGQPPFGDTVPADDPFDFFFANPSEVVIAAPSPVFDGHTTTDAIFSELGSNSPSTETRPVG